MRSIFHGKKATEFTRAEVKKALDDRVKALAAEIRQQYWDIDHWNRSNPTRKPIDPGPSPHLSDRELVAEYLKRFGPGSA